MSVVINGTTGITSPSPFVLEGSTSGTVTVAAPAVAGTNTQTLVAVTGTLAPIVLGTVATASTASVDFTGIPSWAKRVTVMYSGLSTNGTSDFMVQLGDGAVETTGYISTVISVAGSTSGTAFTTGFGTNSSVAASAYSGQVIISLMDVATNTWTYTSTITAGSTTLNVGGGAKSLSSTLDRVRITTVGGANTFDAGTINILYE
jgi:hypothetical protein